MVFILLQAPVFEFSWALQFFSWSGRKLELRTPDINVYNSPVLQSARPLAVALASYTGVDKIIKNTVGFTRKDI